MSYDDFGDDEDITRSLTDDMWPLDFDACPPDVQPSVPVVELDGQDGHGGHEDGTLWPNGVDCTSALNLIAWIGLHCRLVPDDEAFLSMRLRGVSGEECARMASGFVQAWLAASQAEPNTIGKENSGRRAASRTLPPLQRHETEKHKAIRMNLSGERLGYTKAR